MLFNILRSTSFVLLLLNLVLFISQFSKLNKAYRIFTFYLALILTIEIVIRVVVNFGYQNIIFSHVYFTGQFILLSLFYLSILTEKYQRKIVKFKLILIPIILLIYFAVEPSYLHEFCLLEIILTSLSLILYSTFHFYNMLSNNREYYFINAGILIYLFGSTITFLPRNLHVFYGKNFSYILNMLNIILYLLYLILIFLQWRKLYIRIQNEKN